MQFNKQGRKVSESMRFRAFKKYVDSLPKRNEWQEFDYEGFKVCGRIGEAWFIADWQTIYNTKREAMDAIDRCLALRAELAL